MSEEVPIELYRKTNNEFVKYVRYDDYKKLKNIIKEVRELLKNDYFEDGSFTNHEKVFELLDKGETYENN